MKSNQPLVSIITPVYNGSRYIEELIESVLEQDYPCIEHIIIDDGSTDKGATVEILKRYPHLRWWSRPNKGAYATINEGLIASIGELVTVICADDKYASKSAITSVAKVFSRHRICDVVYGDTIHVSEDGQPHALEGPRSGPLWIFKYYPGVAHCSLLVKREKIVDAGLLFDETFPYSADFDWIMRMIRAGYKFRRLRQPIAMFRCHPAQRSNDISLDRLKEKQRIKDRYGEGNKLLRVMIRRWVALTRLKNLLFRCGVISGMQELRLRWRGWSSKSQYNALR